MVKRCSLALFTSCIMVLTAFVVNFPTWTSAVGQVSQGQVSQSQVPQRQDNNLAQTTVMTADYWLIKSLALRTLACMCANRYPFGLGAGQDSDFTFRVVKNSNNEESAIHSVCVKKNQERDKRVLGHITLPLIKGNEIFVTTPGDDRHNPGAAVLRERLKGALLIPFKRQGYRLSQCPTDREHYQGLNWAEPVRWPAM